MPQIKDLGKAKNGQSAAKTEREGSTTIPPEGSTLKLVEVGRPKQIELWDKI